MHRELADLASYLGHEREAILSDWRSVVGHDPTLSKGRALPPAELYDHIPALLSAFEQSLRHAADPAPDDAANEPAAAHGLQRWRQGYDLREVTRELGQLNGCVFLQLDRYASAHSGVSANTLSRARDVWARLCSTAIEESVAQYYAMQQREAAGHISELENALEQIRELEQQRGDQWRQAAHDLRGTLGVVANVAVGLTRRDARESTRDEFVRILVRNVTSLHHLLDDVTSLARLQAGREQRRIEALDVAAILLPLCQGIRPLAQQHGLYLRCNGVPGYAVDGDAVKIGRIAQNLLLNAVKYTKKGGITVAWGDSEPQDSGRWSLCVRDTGPGFHYVPDPASVRGEAPEGTRAGEAGEGIGLSIVKRLCEMLGAQIDVQSVKSVGTTFKILFPKHYVD